MKHTRPSILSIFISSRLIVWIFLFLLGVLLFYGLVSLPPLDDNNPTFHVASRYLDHGLDETGFSSAFLAVLLDYRSFDLILFDLFFFTLTLTILLFCMVENLPIQSFEWVLASGSLLSSLILFVLGSLGLKDGSNFMDYEFGSVFFGSNARVYGPWITGGLVLITVFSSLKWISKIWTLRKEKRFDV